MIEESSPAARRLRALGGASADVAPLWLETLAPAEALSEARAREGAVFRLQEADALLALGRGTEATELLAVLGALPPGLAELRQRLEARAGPAGPATFAEGPASGPEAELLRWLERVRSWRMSALV